MAIAHLFKSHDKDLGGGFTVRRILPAAARQSIGPFLFFDHMGPVEAQPGARHDVRPHPHIGLATVTYLFEGAIMHRDSLGTEQRIEPGAINWMTAGSGIVHSERTPEDLLDRVRRTHGLQLWAALPREHEEAPAAFSHTPANQIPEVEFEGATVRVLVGTAFGRTSPVPTFSTTLYLDVQLAPGASIDLGGLPEESAVYAPMGAIEVDGEAIPANTMAMVEPGMPVRVSSSAGARFVLIGGEPLDGRRYIFWNFVSSSRERIEQAARDWEANAFVPVPGDEERIPLPAWPAAWRHDGPRD
ncbi:pirin family protein [Massilia alkalitolerans]|jgi:redox-sensitive bicupin YhaK (pirin superfamily)|uniref:pirin family protein n=1 Tax=Massilia alkalitolerans TaxID=286638 RepID=UPI0003F67039|nr:pirin family protein [Massilia alkalitolerans]